MRLERQVTRLARKKIVFIIVEGPSDDEALGVLFNRMFDRNSVFVHIMHRDITTDRGVRQDNILSRLGNDVRTYAKSNHFTSKDFQEIIHITDMDGAYVPDECITEDPSAKHPIYSTERITTCSVKAIIARNGQKRQNLDKLCTCNHLWNIPYRVFYMSCNLDHVLYDKLNTTDTEKEADAYAFALRYRNDIAAFRSFISDSDFSVSSSYKDSWNFIKAGMESLKRHTNLGLCFPPAP